MNKTEEWVKTCLRKKKLKEEWADSIIKKATVPLRKYSCPHCFAWHIANADSKKQTA